MARNDQLIRQHRLVQCLARARYGHTLGELREAILDDLGLATLSERTVRRDLEALQAAGFDIDTDAEERGTVWKAGPGLKSAPQITLSALELMGLSAGRALLTPLVDTPFGEGIELLWRRLEEQLPEPVLRQFERQRRALYIHTTPPRNYADKRGMLSTFNRAIMQHRLLEIAYVNGKGEHIERVVEPRSVVLTGGSIYLFAAVPDAPEDRRVRMYKLDRFERATALDTRFTPDLDFDPSERFGDGLTGFKSGPVRDFVVRFDVSVSSWVRDAPFHPKQRLEETPEGLVAHVSAHQGEIFSRLLPLGDRVEILAPEEARAAMRTRLQKAAALYDEG
ncbi:MAG: helix-turn-helix transcriptional regulator [Bradymonadia bacterium]